MISQAWIIAKTWKQYQAGDSSKSLETWTWYAMLYYSILVLKFGLIFLIIWNLSQLIHLKNNIKTSCYLAKIPVDFCLLCLSLFVTLFWCPLFPFIFYLYSFSPHPLLHMYAFLPMFLVVVLLTYIWRWLDATFLLLLVKRLQSHIDLC